jgi:hypothetical protein
MTWHRWELVLMTRLRWELPLPASFVAFGDHPSYMSSACSHGSFVDIYYVSFSKMVIHTKFEHACALLSLRGVHPHAL